MTSGQRVSIELGRAGRRVLNAVHMVSALSLAAACGGPQGEERDPPKDRDSALTEPESPPTFDGGVKPTHGKFVGNITQRFQVPSDFGTYWNQITPENEGKWGSVERERDQMEWGFLDAIHDYAREQGIPVKGHTLVWGSQSPGWMEELSEAEQAEEVEEWIEAYCQRYPDVQMIDVVNEPDHATPSYIDALGGRGRSGHDWVIWSFEKARQHCPQATLILNDYNVLRHDTFQFMRIAELLAERGLLDAIGCQAHGLETQRLGELRDNLEYVSSLGAPIYISEYDIDVADDDEQRRIMEEQFSLFFESEAVVGITLWGYIHGQTWKPDTGLLRDGQPRPAFTWLIDYLD